MPPDSHLQITPHWAIPQEEFQFTFARSGGPGGQNVNKVNSKALLRWAAMSSPSLSPEQRQRFVARFKSRLTTEGDLLIVGQRFRDQAKNVEDCLERLRQMLHEIAAAPKNRRATRPTKASRRRRLADKRHQTERKAGRRRVEGE